MSVDDLFSEVGQCGLYQIRQYALMAFPIVFSAYQTIAFIFAIGKPEYRCLIPECEFINTNACMPSWYNLTAPTAVDGSMNEDCLRYLPLINYTMDTCSSEMFDELETIKCDKFVFLQTERTVASDFEIICEDNEWKILLIGVFTYVGFFIGMPVAGLLSDSYGRKSMLIWSCILQGIIGILRSSTENYEQFLLLQFLGAFCCGAYNAGFILALEALGPKMRVLGNSITCCFHALGEVNVGVTMWLVQDWRVMDRILFAPGLFAIAYFWLVPESVRWLLSKGRTEEAIDVFIDIARINRRQVNPSFERRLREFLDHQAQDNQNFQIDEDTQESTRTRTRVPCQCTTKHDTTKLNSCHPNSQNSTVRLEMAGSSRNTTMNSIKKICRSRILLNRILCAAICWSINSMVFYGLSLKSVTVSGNKYANFILIGIVEIPAYMTTYFLMDIHEIGRRSTLSTSMLLTGVTSVLYFVIEGCQSFHLMTLLFGKFFITLSFGVLYVYTAEMFPTELRNSIFGLCSMCGHIGSIFAPVSLVLVRAFDPIIIWGMAAIFAGITAQLFPETQWSKFPDTIEDAEKLGT